jgi:DnaD/phage-associated family protein
VDRVRLTSPKEGGGARGERARLYVRWMPRLGAEAVALYELLRLLPEIGVEEPEVENLARLLRSTPEEVEEAIRSLAENGFIIPREGWREVVGYPPSPPSEKEIEVVRAEAEAGISPEDYFHYMGTLPSPHVLEFLNGYCRQDGMTTEVIKEALRIASEREVRRLGYVRGILEEWVRRGVKTPEEVQRVEKERGIKLVAEGGVAKGEGVSYGADQQSAARRREGYEWLFDE